MFSNPSRKSQIVLRPVCTLLWPTMLNRLVLNETRSSWAVNGERQGYRPPEQILVVQRHLTEDLLLAEPEQGAETERPAEKIVVGPLEQPAEAFELLVAEAVTERVAGASTSFRITFRLFSLP